MYQSLGRVRLRSGEPLECGVVQTPDLAWRDRLTALLTHKGDLWNWQNWTLLSADAGIDVRYHVLHRDGVPVSNVMTVECAGVGILGHVWTSPPVRGQGAVSRLMEIVMEGFAARGGKALFLETGYDSSAYHIYNRFGFRSVEPLSECMEFYSHAKPDFEADYFAGLAAIQPLDWPHWPGAQALFAGDFPGLVRWAAAHLIGRASAETPLLPLLRDELARDDGAKRARVLASEQSGAVVGMALWSEHPFWPQADVVDVYCHPRYWSQADDLLAALALPEARRLIAYADEHDPLKPDLLLRHGFRQTSVLPARIARSAAKTEFLDVRVFEK